MKPLLYVLALLLLSAGPVAADTEPKADATPVTVPFELLPTKHMAVMVKVNGKGPYRVIFDTGAPVTLFSTKVAKESGLIARDAGPGFGLFGAAQQVPVKELEVGDLKAEGAKAVVLDHPLVEAMAKDLGPLEGIVGFPFFARYK